jgi:hypothetical protein
MLDRRDPEFPALRADQHWRLDKEYLAGTIGESTYLRSLFNMGVRNDEARQSLRELNEIKGRVRDHEEVRMEKSKAWLETYSRRRVS